MANGRESDPKRPIEGAILDCFTDVLGRDFVMGVVEIDEIAGEDIDRAHCEADLLLVDQVEIYQFDQGFSQWRRVVIARRCFGAGRAEPRIGLVRLKETPAGPWSSSYTC